MVNSGKGGNAVCRDGAGAGSRHHPNELSYSARSDGWGDVRKQSTPFLGRALTADGRFCG